MGRPPEVSGTEVSRKTCHAGAAVGRTPSLRANFSWIAAGNAVSVLSRWGNVIVLAHLGNPAMIGQVVLAFAVCAPVSALSCLGLRTAVVTDAKREYRFGDYLALRLITAVLALLAIAGIVLSGGFELQTALVILAVGVGETIISVSDIFHALLQQHERMDRIAISLMIRGPLMLVLLAAGVYLTGNVLWGIAGFPVAMMLTFLAYDLPNGVRIVHGPLPGDATGNHGGLKPRWDARVLVKLAWLALPLGVILMIAALATSIPRYMVCHYLGEHALGVFASVTYLAVVGAKVVTAIGQSAAPRLAGYYAAENTAAYRRLLGKLLVLVAGLGAAVVLVIALLGGPFLSLLYGPEFARYADLAVYLMLAGAVTYLTVPLGAALESMRRFKTHMVVRGLSILVLAALLPGLIGAYGLKGAAMAMLAGSTCSVLGCASVLAYKRIR